MFEPLLYILDALGRNPLIYVLLGLDMLNSVLRKRRIQKKLKYGWLVKYD
jgi:hypothetical protein